MQHTGESGTGISCWWPHGGIDNKKPTTTLLGGPWLIEQETEHDVPSASNAVSLTSPDRPQPPKTELEKVENLEKG